MSEHEQRHIEVLEEELNRVYSKIRRVKECLSDPDLSKMRDHIKYILGDS